MDDLDNCTRFHRDGPKFRELLRFENHAGVDGIILGHPGAAHRLKFTKAQGLSAGRALPQE